MRIVARPWFPALVLLGVLALVLGAALAPRPNIRLDPRPDWSGSWDTIWEAGGATLHLEQRGEVVTGVYPLYEGEVSAQVDGQHLRGRWVQPERQGTFEMLLAPDGKTFAGRFENQQYWNGRRIDRGEERKFYQPDLRSPRDAVATFLDSMYWSRNGQHERLETAFRAVDFREDEGTIVATRAADAGLLFDVIDRTTFSLRDLLGREDDQVAESLTVPLRQAGTGITFELSLARDEGGEWRMRWPGEEPLREKLEEFLKARGEERQDPSRHLKLSSPRATMQSFLENTGQWSDRGAEVALACLDLSEIDASVRAIDGQLFAFTMKRVIDAIGYVHLWGIPDDPRDPLPYLHYRHALGDIVIARMDEAPAALASRGAEETRASVPRKKAARWAFTSESLGGIREMYDALEGLAPAAGVHGLPDDPYFQLRQFSRSVSPDLVKRHFLLETWQWLALFLLAFGGWWIAGLAHRAVRAVLLPGAAGGAGAGDDGEPAPDRAQEPSSSGYAGQAGDESSLEWRFLIPMRVAVTAGVWLYGLRFLGLPDRLQLALLTIALVSGVLGLVWLIIASISAGSARLLAKARMTQTRLDEILVTLLASVAKIGAVILGLVLLAEGLALPYQSVLAGIGIGGLAVAIAARDTVANFFGSAVLISDRPFKRGDLVEVMGHVGEVERVGIRSTHIRTYEDSVVVIPNSTLVNELIDNRGRRRRRKVDIIVGVQYDSPPAKVQRLVEDLRVLVAKQPTGIEGATMAGLWEFSGSSIDVRLWCYLDVQTLGEERVERHRLLLDVMRLVEDLGLSFAFPTRTLHLSSVPTSEENSGPIRLGHPTE